MHAIAPVLAAEKSHVPFFIAGGLLVVWALVLALVIGMRRESFPDNIGGQRAVSAVSIILVLAAMAAAVLSSGGAQATVVKSPGVTLPAIPPPPGPPGTAGSSESSGEGGSSASGGAAAGGSASSSGSSSSSAAGGQKLALSASTTGQLAYDTKTLTAKAGAVTIDFTNASPLEHNVVIAQGSTVIGQTPPFIGGSKSVSVNLKPGTYTYYCSVPGHRQAGMEGTLTVK